MRYQCNSWSDVDRALEAFKYARRSLLVVLALAMPFAAWDAVSSAGMVAGEDAGTVQTVKQPEPAVHVLPVHFAHPGATCERPGDTAKVSDATV